ncbi:MAG: glycosyltransferase family 4 protein [Methylacidiphilales bacterium]|nr:glycosyltransferase family 4 protein [Candidatus Methylacidiphilales bacterium]
MNAAAFPRLFACDFPAKPQKEPLAVLRSLMRFRELIRTWRPDIVHVNGVDIFQALWAFPFARPYRIVRTHHAVRRIPTDMYHRWLYQRVVNANIFVSEAARNICCAESTAWTNSYVIEKWG